jgi:allantoinase
VDLRDVRRFDYSAVIDREPLTLQGDARLALWVIVNVEHYEYLPAVNPQRDPWPSRPHPDVVNYARRDYGNRVGVWRMFDLFDKHRLQATVSLNAAVLDHFPDIAAELATRDWDVMAHGVYNTRYAAGLSEQAEREMIADAVDTVQSRIAKSVSGWLGPALTTTPVTMDLLAEAGIAYVGDYLHDDEPGSLRVRRGRLVSLPYSIHLNDSPLVGRLQHSGSTFARLARDQFDALYAESASHPKIMAICLHPYAIDAPSRHRHLDDLLTYVTSHDGVIVANGQQLADHYVDSIAAASRDIHD